MTARVIVQAEAATLSPTLATSAVTKLVAAPATALVRLYALDALVSHSFVATPAAAAALRAGGGRGPILFTMPSCAAYPALRTGWMVWRPRARPAQRCTLCLPVVLRTWSVHWIIV